jgi:hypothetical protein
MNFGSWNRDQLLTALFRDQVETYVQRCWNDIHLNVLRYTLADACVRTAQTLGWALNPNLAQCIAGTMNYMHRDSEDASMVTMSPVEDRYYTSHDGFALFVRGDRHGDHDR